MPHTFYLYLIDTIFFHRILNYIDIDCGPNGDCPEHAETARTDFRPIFIAGWERALSKIGPRFNSNILNYLNKKCPETLRSKGQCSQKFWRFSLM